MILSGSPTFPKLFFRHAGVHFLQVREMDGVLGKILDTLDAKNLSDSVNVIVVSDHGMTDNNLTTQVSTPG